MAEEYKRKSGQKENSIRISAVPNQLAFSPAELRLKAGTKISLNFDNPDIQIHNLVIVRPGSEEIVGKLADEMAQDPDAFQRQFVPDSNNIIWSTPLLNAKESFKGDFDVPSSPGKYPFICSFPGHWRAMKGTIIVYK